jgi:hypothetical protein
MSSSTGNTAPLFISSSINIHYLHGFDIRQDLGHQNSKVTHAFISLVGTRYDGTSIKSKDIRRS